jgi:exonuclease VII small subunit
MDDLANRIEQIMQQYEEGAITAAERDAALQEAKAEIQQLTAAPKRGAAETA